MVDSGRNAALASKIRTLAIALDLALIALLATWQLASNWSPLRIVLAVLLTLPLLAPLRGLLHGNRRTFAWTTLCTIPYLVIGLTETIARPNERSWTGPCLALALALFVTLIAYLRITRDPFAALASRQPEPSRDQ